jgi:MYXO-CTERM domain-containing protein
MVMIYCKRIAMIFLGGLLLAIPSLQAVVLPPVTVAVAPDDFTASGAGDIIAGGPLAVTLVSPAVSTTFTGVIKSNVYHDSFTGDLDFVYQYTALTGETIGKITVANFNPSIADGIFADPFGVGGPGVDVGIRNDVAVNAGLLAAGFIPSLGPNPPNTVDRSNAGAVVEFNFEGPFGIPPGATTELLIVRTHATTFTTGKGGIIDSQTANVNVYAPSPEPRLVGLAAIGLLGLVAFFFRRRKVQVTE